MIRIKFTNGGNLIFRIVNISSLFISILLQLHNFLAIILLIIFYYSQLFIRKVVLTLKFTCRRTLQLIMHILQRLIFIDSTSVLFLLSHNCLSRHSSY